MFLTWLTPVGLRRLTRHYDRARGKRQRVCVSAAHTHTHRQAHTHKNKHVCPPCVILSSSLAIALFSPLFLHSVFLTRGCFLGRHLLRAVSLIASVSYCRLLSVFRYGLSLFARGHRHAHKGSSPVACPSCLTAKQINITEQPFSKSRGTLLQCY